MIEDSRFLRRHSERNHLHLFQPLAPLLIMYVNLVLLLLGIPVGDWDRVIFESGVKCFYWQPSEGEFYVPQKNTLFKVLQWEIM